MGRAQQPLTKTLVEKAAPSADGDIFLWDSKVPGFGVRIYFPAANGVPRRSYIFQYRALGRSRRATIGVHGPLTVEKARTIAADMYEAVRKGGDPVAERRRAAQQKPMTVGVVVDEFMLRFMEGDGQKHAPSYVKGTRRLFDNHVLPKWKGRDIASITRADAIELLDGIADQGMPIAANRVRAALSKLFNWCIQRGRPDVNPISVLDRPGQETARERVLSDDEIRLLWPLMGELGEPWAGLFRFALVTAQRRGECADIRREAVAPDGIWTLSGHETKNGVVHVVPLPALALEILRAQPELGPYYFTTLGDRHVSGFGKVKARLDLLALEKSPENNSSDRLLVPSARKGSITIAAVGHAPFSQADEGRLIGIRHGDAAGRARITRVIAPGKVNAEVQSPFGETAPSDAWRLDLPHWTIHDLRRTAATGMARVGVSRFIQDRVLNHVDRTIGGVYDRWDYLPEKRAALETWAHHLSRLTGANVVEMPARLSASVLRSSA